MLADSYNNAAFSILSGIVGTDGFYDETATVNAFEKNVVGLFTALGDEAPDPLGFGPNKANIASPPYSSTYGSAEAAQKPTKIFTTLANKNYYVNGVEKSRLNTDVHQILDGYGDGYWIGQIISKTAGTGKLEVTYSILEDLSASNLKVGKTLVVQSFGQGSLKDFGRFIIKQINFNCSPNNDTEITVYDAVHANGSSGSGAIGITLPVDGYVAIYFNSDSVSFNDESSSDFDI